MASPAASMEFTREAARESLIAISQSVPGIGSPLKVNSPNAATANGNHDRAEKYRSKLISISYQCPDAEPMQCPPKNCAA